MIFASDLTWILLLPVIGAMAAYAAPVRIARWSALLFAAATFVLSLVIFFRIAANGYNFGNLNNPVDSIRLPWIDFTASTVHFRIDYFLGVDGLSLPLVMLNALLTVLAIIGGWERPRAKEYMALLLLLETGVMGVFLSLDLLLFFLFWEVELAPMFLLIGIWGSDVIKHGMPGRIYSAWKFLLYTFFGSIFMLAGILLLYFKLGATTASMQFFSTHFLGGTVTIPLIGVTMSLQLLTFLLIFLAFAIKIPMFPFHTWLPDAHTDASTEVSVILAGILLKMGAYGLISRLPDPLARRHTRVRRLVTRDLSDKYPLRCRHLPCSDGYEEIDRLFQRQPHGHHPAGCRCGCCYAYFRQPGESIRDGFAHGSNGADGESRTDYRSAVLLRRCDLRTRAHTRNIRLWRCSQENAAAGNPVYFRRAGFTWIAWTGRLCGGVYDLYRQLPDHDDHYRSRRLYDDPHGQLPTVDAQTRFLWTI